LIDGFNLYNGLKAAHGRKLLWLNPEALSRALLSSNQTLIGCCYCTARVRNDPRAQARQRTFLGAVEASIDPQVTRIIYGRFQEKRRTCYGCNRSYTDYEEKETDVSLAVLLVEAAAGAAYDVAFVMSGDGDLGPAIEAARRVHPDGRIVATFPPRRVSDRLRRLADSDLTIGEANIRAAQMPPKVTGEGGRVYERPTSWH
jgi:uncharacterized LabA/DUF88 family protein